MTVSLEWLRRSLMMFSPSYTNYPLNSGNVLETYDAFLFGIPTRLGSFPAQWKAFWYTTGKQWSSGGFHCKYAGLCIATGTKGGRQGVTTITAMSTVAHHGMIYVPLGYKTTFSIQSGWLKSEAALPGALGHSLWVWNSLFVFKYG